LGPGRYRGGTEEVLGSDWIRSILILAWNGFVTGGYRTNPGLNPWEYRIKVAVDIKRPGLF